MGKGDGRDLSVVFVPATCRACSSGNPKPTRLGVIPHCQDGGLVAVFTEPVSLEGLGCDL